MLNALKFIVSLAVAIVVFVNRLSRGNVKRGDLIVYGDSTLSISRVAAMGGDTIEVGGESFVINNYCSDGCDCGACRNYLLVSGNDSAIISGNDIVGKAYTLKFRLKSE